MKYLNQIFNIYSTELVVTESETTEAAAVGNGRE